MGILYEHSDKVLTVRLAGNCVKTDFLKQAQETLGVLTPGSVTRVFVDATELKAWDSTALAVLFEVQKKAHRHDIPVKMQGIPDGMAHLLELAFTVKPADVPKEKRKPRILDRIGGRAVERWRDSFKGLEFIDQTFKSIGRFVRGKAVLRRVDFLFALEETGPQAIMIVSLVSFMVGLILAFVSSIQLKLFGAEVYVATLVAVGVTRIIGAMMAGIIMAGRTGAAYAANIGTMQVNEELDALKTMGISRMDFLVLPRVLALVITMPVLTMLADFAGMAGGAAVGLFLLDIPYQEYIRYTMDALVLKHFLVGIFHGLVYGVIISICGCYYGIYCGRDASSVGFATTRAVVASIVWMVLATGFITWIFSELGI